MFKGEELVKIPAEGTQRVGLYVQNADINVSCDFVEQTHVGDQLIRHLGTFSLKPNTKVNHAK